MAKRVIWSEIAVDTFKCILLYYVRITGSVKYSHKLEQHIKESISQISKYPHIGKVSEHESVREYSVRNYKIIYQIRPDQIVILIVWDTRQNPQSLSIDNLIIE